MSEHLRQVPVLTLAAAKAMAAAAEAFALAHGGTVGEVADAGLQALQV